MTISNNTQFKHFDFFLHSRILTFALQCVPSQIFNLVRLHLSEEFLLLPMIVHAFVISVKSFQCDFYEGMNQCLILEIKIWVLIPKSHILYK